MVLMWNRIHTIRSSHNRNKSKLKLNQLHDVFRIQQDRQREPSVKTLRSPLFFSVAELNAKILHWCQSEEMKQIINNNLFPQMGIEPTTVATHPCASASEGSGTF